MTHKFKIIERIRKPSPSPSSSLRLHRAEFGDNVKKKYDRDSYYPDTNYLINELSKFYKISNKNITVGLGAEGIIKDIFLTIFLKNKRIRLLTFSPNFFMYNYYSRLFNFKFFSLEILKKKDSLVGVKDIINSIKKNKINFLVLVNPSSPIQRKWTKLELIEILDYCSKRNILVLIDEVYKLNQKDRSEKLIKKYKNLIFLNSFSKSYGLPGIRLGFCFSNKEFTKELNTCRMAIELPANTINKSIIILKNFKKKIEPKVIKIIQYRKFALKEFKKIGIKTMNSDINSVNFFCDSKKQKDRLIKIFLKNKIYVNSVNSKYFENIVNITTTNINNLKKFFLIIKKFKFNAK